MACDLCARDFNNDRRKPFCASCACAALYEPRYQQGSALLDREQVHTQAEAVTRPYNDGVLAALPADVDLDVLGASSKKFNSQRREAEQQAIDDRISQITDKAEELEKQIQDCREYIAAQKQSFKQRRSDLAIERKEAEKSKPRLLEPVQFATKKTLQKLDKTRNRITDARFLLCKEAASASNLQRRKTLSGKSEYIIGGISIPDLRDLNLKTQISRTAISAGSRTIAEPHDLVSEALDNVARLTNLCAHYLQVRVPAEIILPHENFPRSVIMPEKSSYKVSDIPCPRISSSQSSSPAASRILAHRDMPRPRPLYLDRPLAQLAKEDPKAYGLFIEGATLLAWDLAWLCKSQGVASINTFEDVCAIGRNIWQLFYGAARKGDEPRERRSSAAVKDPTAPKLPDTTPSFPLGTFSHASAARNLASAAGLELFKDWRLAASSARLSDKLKAFLLNEISGAEWDLLEEREWDEEREDEKPVLVGGSRRVTEARQAALSVMSVAPSEEGERKGNSGWMKVRGRGEDS